MKGEKEELVGASDDMSNAAIRKKRPPDPSNFVVAGLKDALGLRPLRSQALVFAKSGAKCRRSAKRRGEMHRFGCQLQSLGLSRVSVFPAIQICSVSRDWVHDKEPPFGPARV